LKPKATACPVTTIVETAEPDIEEDVEMDESFDDAAFIDEQEEDADVTGISMRIFEIVPPSLAALTARNGRRKLTHASNFFGAQCRFVPGHANASLLQPFKSRCRQTHLAMATNTKL
jgi:hypothetical protein